MVPRRIIFMLCVINSCVGIELPKIQSLKPGQSDRNLSKVLYSGHGIRPFSEAGPSKALSKIFRSSNPAVAFRTVGPEVAVRRQQVAGHREKIKSRARSERSWEKLFQKRLQAVSMTTPREDQRSSLALFQERPARAVIALVWLAFCVYTFGFSPGPWNNLLNPLSEEAPDVLLTIKTIQAYAQPDLINAIWFFVFNAFGVLPAIVGGIVLPGSKDQAPLPTVPVVAASFGIGWFVLGPYFALCKPSQAAITKSDLGLFQFVESRLYGGALFAAACSLVYGLVSIPDFASASAEFQ